MYNISECAPTHRGSHPRRHLVQSHRAASRAVDPRLVERIISCYVCFEYYSGFKFPYFFYNDFVNEI